MYTLNILYGTRFEKGNIIHSKLFRNKFFEKRRFALRATPPGISIDNVEGMVTGVAAEKRVRSPIVDGLFYPEEKAGVLSYMRSIGLERGRGGCAQAIIAPHGAWELSGSLAGAAFESAGGRTGRKSPSKVVIMGPIHNSREKGLFLSNSHFFQTPLGDLPVDRETIEWLQTYNSLFQENDIPHLQEHSIEVLLPFVKYYFPHAAIVPILIGKPREQHISVLANALRAVFEPIMHETLIVISFNLAIHAGKDAALEMARDCMQLFRNGRHDDLRLALQNGSIVSCGGALVAALLQSGLVDSARPGLASESLLSARGEKDGTVFYGAFSFV